MYLLFYVCIETVYIFMYVLFYVCIETVYISLCMYVLCLHRDWLCGPTWGKVCVWEEFWNVNLFMTEFDCPEVIQCGWQDVKIHLLIHSLHTGPGILYLSRCITISRRIRCWSNVFAVIVVQLPDCVAVSCRIEYWSIVFAIIWTMSSEMYSSDVEN